MLAPTHYSQRKESGFPPRPQSLSLNEVKERGLQPQFKMKYCVAGLMYKEGGLEVACAQAAKAGLEGIDLWASPGMCEHIKPAMTTEEIHHIHDVLNRYQLEPASLTAYFTHGPNIGIQGLLQRMRIAKKIGASFVVTNMAGDTYEITLEEYAKHLSPAISLAEELQMRIAFENNSSQPLTWTTERILEMAEAIQSPFFGFTIVPAHLVNKGSDVVQTLQALGPRVFNFYGWDHIPKVNDDGNDYYAWPVDPVYHFPGQGKLPFDKYIQTLKKIGYDGWITIHSHGCEKVMSVSEITERTSRSVNLLRSFERNH